ENLNNIKKTFIREIGHVPPNVEIISWFTFLLRDGVRPYHNSLSSGDRVVSLNFLEGSRFSVPHLKFVKLADTERYYFDSGRNIYTDVLSQFVYECNKKTQGLVISRLEQIYSSIF